MLCCTWREIDWIIRESLESVKLSSAWDPSWLKEKRYKDLLDFIWGGLCGKESEPEQAPTAPTVGQSQKTSPCPPHSLTTPPDSRISLFSILGSAHSRCITTLHGHNAYGRSGWMGMSTPGNLLLEAKDSVGLMDSLVLVWSVLWSPSSLEEMPVDKTCAKSTHIQVITRCSNLDINLYQLIEKMY